MKSFISRFVMVGAVIFGLVVPSASLMGMENETTGNGREVKVKQEPGKTVYWILPGPRRLSERVFGVPGHPLRTGKLKIQQAKGAVKDLFKRFPIMAGVPLKLRAMNTAKTKFSITKKPTPVSDRGKIVSGRFEITFKDRQPYDLPGNPTNTLDDVDLTVSFTDPAGNRYKIEILKLYQPPFPGFESGGGVVTDGWTHGGTGTDSPLFPKVFTYGAFWGIGNLIINGKLADQNKWVHLMTTQIVRDKNYRLAVGEELPLKPENTIAGRVHHTHLIVRPIKITSQGPRFEPVKTAFALPNGKKQPFIHVMFEEDTIVKDAFQNWPSKSTTKSAWIGGKNSTKLTVEGREFSLLPSKITVRKGERITILFKNVGKIAHNLEIGEFGVKTETILGGKTGNITFTPKKTGTFSFWCAVPGHRDAGMKGKLIVKD